jgi:hypothetical protein
VAGPVIPLSQTETGPGELLGGSSTRSANPDPVANRVLTRGEPIAGTPGRADDFSWPRSNSVVGTDPIPAVAAHALLQKRSRPNTGPGGPSAGGAPRPPGSIGTPQPARGWFWR